MSHIGIIPARMESSRLPGKLLLAETGKPLIQYAWEAATKAQSLSEVIVATDSPQIARTVESFGGRVEMTGEHPSGTDRSAEVIAHCGPQHDLVVNIQGDEPELEPGVIDRLVGLLEESPHAEMATLATPINEHLMIADSACVKVVCAADGRAMYFSRAPIPFSRDQSPQELLADLADHDSGIRIQPPWLLHMGIYAYRREFLLAFTQMRPSRLEEVEKLEQLRALEAGATIQVGVVPHATVGIDTPDDYARFVQRVRG